MEKQMAYETRPMTGSVFFNDSGRGKSAYSGTIKLDDGRELWINLFENQTKAGKLYYGIMLKDKASYGGPPQVQAQAPVKQVTNISEEISDEVPF
jgi:hypothetical protein